MNVDMSSHRLHQVLVMLSHSIQRFCLVESRTVPANLVSVGALPEYILALWRRAVGCEATNRASMALSGIALLPQAKQLNERPNQHLPVLTFSSRTSDAHRKTQGGQLKSTLLHWLARSRRSPETTWSKALVQPLKQVRTGRTKPRRAKGRKSMSGRRRGDRKRRLGASLVGE
jgi:hypothetical protein